MAGGEGDGSMRKADEYLHFPTRAPKTALVDISPEARTHDVV